MPSLPIEDQDQFMGKQSHPTHFADSSRQEITQSIEDTRHQQPEVSIPTLIGLVFLFAILCVSIANFVSRKHCADLAPDQKPPQVTVKQ